ncbi:2OG-Fe(II) oxygenase [Silanimonas sp.]|uniref:2OG-Fe(II) oxygenase n=1 Tax=Silanimonas sp. TaxID=1929290 RepID=UPI0022BD2BEB|nr:2OG-Fe(II) oxygenase [Silanimonas sp.]MCZ8114979.1 2OG-Fe(II) oxygenase [Silanimonas sp.]
MDRYALAFSLLERGDPTAAAQEFQGLADSGHAGALHHLARLHLYRMLPEPDLAAARGWLHTVADAGDLEACWTRALVEAGEPDGRWADDLQRVAAAGHPPALRSLGLLYAGQPDAASQAWAMGLFERAAGRGDGLARALREAMGPRPGPAPQAAPPLDIGHASRTFAPLSDDEDWRLQAGALSPLEALHCRGMAWPLLAPSQAFDPETGSGHRMRLRTSDDAQIDPLMEDVALRLLQRRLCALSGQPLAHAEPVVVLRYRPGQEYRLHRDLLPPSTLADPDQGRGGQRVATVIAYLTPVEAGGETDFPRRNLRVRPEAGSALVFRNLRPDGSVEEDSLHAGLPVTRGEKWIATLWVRGGAVRGF